MAAPMAPITAVGMTRISGVFPAERKLACRKSTSAFTARDCSVCLLKDKPRAQCGQVWHLGDMQKTFLGSTVANPASIFFRPPPLALKVDDVSLQKHCASIAENRHCIGVEGSLGIVLDGNAQPLGRGLKKVPVAGRALRVQFEVLDAPIAENDELDILAANVHDHMRVLEECMADSVWATVSTQSHVCLQHPLQDVLGITPSCRRRERSKSHPEIPPADGDWRRSQLCPEWISVRELIGFSQNVALFRQEYGLGGCGTAIETDEGPHSLAGMEGHGNKARPRVEGFEVFATLSLKRSNRGWLKRLSACAVPRAHSAQAALSKVPANLSDLAFAEFNRS